jgi:peptidoglycan hydrolase-like protein with peptidoglycan-binding domain
MTTSSAPSRAATSRRRPIRTTAAIALAAVGLFATACGNDDDTSSSTTTTAAEETTTTESAATAATIRFDKEIQQELYDVGCHPGEVDGIMGPQTDAAILAFQEAAGLEADGELGPETEAALKKDAAAGTQVCGTSSSTTTTAKANSTTTTAANGQAPCTATALLGGLPAEGETIGSFQCADGYAAGSLTDGTKFLLQSEGGKWYAPSQDPCGSASAGIPPAILEAGCPA